MNPMLWRNVGDEFGAAVAVGNFHNLDSTETSETDQARLPEVAVGMPGGRGGEGRVVVFLTGDHGIRDDATLDEVTEFPGPSGAAGYGAAMAAGFAQATFWEDLAVGAPDHLVGAAFDGTVSLTKAMATSTCTEVDNVWELADADGTMVPVQMVNDTRHNLLKLTFQEDFMVRALEAAGTSSERECERPDSSTGAMVVAEFSIPKNTVLTLPGQWPCGGVGSGHTWKDVDLGPMLTGVFSAPAGTYLGDVVLDWRVSPIGGTMTNPTAVVCE